MGLLIPHPVTEWPGPVSRPGPSQSPCLGPPGTAGILLDCQTPDLSYLEARGGVPRSGFDRPQGFEDPVLEPLFPKTFSAAFCLGSLNPAYPSRTMGGHSHAHCIPALASPDLRSTPGLPTSLSQDGDETTYG